MNKSELALLLFAIYMVNGGRKVLRRYLQAVCEVPPFALLALSALPETVVWLVHTVGTVGARKTAALLVDADLQAMGAIQCVARLLSHFATVYAASIVSKLSFNFTALWTPMFLWAYGERVDLESTVVIIVASMLMGASLIGNQFGAVQSLVGDRERFHVDGVGCALAMGATVMLSLCSVLRRRCVRRRPTLTRSAIVLSSRAPQLAVGLLASLALGEQWSSLAALPAGAIVAQFALLPALSSVNRFVELAAYKKFGDSRIGTVLRRLTNALTLAYSIVWLDERLPFTWQYIAVLAALLISIAYTIRTLRLKRKHE
jgi:hypothetical protein